MVASESCTATVSLQGEQRRRRGGGVISSLNKLKGDRISDEPGQPLPVDALDPLAQVLADVHGEGVVVELVHLFQVLAIQHLELAPLRHLGAKRKENKQ